MGMVELAALVASISSVCGIIKFSADVMDRFQKSAVMMAQMQQSIELLHSELKEGAVDAKALDRRVSDLEFWATKGGFTKR